MKISELKAGATNVTIEATVASKQEPREVVTKYGKRLNVANITLKDDSGSIAMSLWGNDAMNINEGDVIKVTNGYVSEFRGSPQLSAGKFGKIEVVTKGEGKAAKQEDEDSFEDMEEGEM
ncbi:MAG: DNA-binding protein [Candidatus Micrarchaeota archaeon]|nr:DNA-binding protein [Candidatus Micrarchaeota archaeon]MDE1804689.1 DNA-binding protein [Candidatus Micrarchaeota archaeon]MDE1846797.1 DNA-binding protein [Candidatus Micrarchaeota archaeon]